MCIITKTSITYFRSLCISGYIKGHHKTIERFFVFEIYEAVLPNLSTCRPQAKGIYPIAGMKNETVNGHN
jgi:hypothetical protein